MFTESDLKKETAERTFQKGRQLYMGGNVQTIQMQDIYVKEKRYQKIKAFVQGSGWKCYHVDITVDEAGAALSSYHCECPANDEYAGVCKHGVAALLRYLAVKKEQQKKLSEPVKKITVEFPDRTKLQKLDETEGLTRGAKFWGEQVDKPVGKGITMPKTDLGLYRILMGNGMERQLQYRQAQVKGKVKIIPVFHISYGKARVEFKIGVSHMYVLKNVLEFEELLRKHERKRYGAKLEFYHHMSAFDEASLPIVKFIRETVRDFRERGGMGVYQYYTGTDTKREIPLAGSRLDTFFALMKDTELEVVNHFEERDIYSLVEEELFLPIRVDGTAAGVRLITQYCEIFEGASYQYMIDDYRKKIHRVSLESISKIMEFRKYMNQQKGKAAFIAQKELPAFCRDLLPELEKHYELDVREFHPERYLPEQVDFEIYLDMPEYDVITCQLKAVYGEEKYNVFSVDRDLARFVDVPADILTQKRDVDKEMEADMAVSTIFTTFDEKKGLKLMQATSDEIYDFLSEGVHELDKIGEVFISDKMKRVQILKTPSFSMGVSLKSNLLQLSLDSKDMPLEQLAEILSQYNRKKKYYRLKNGTFINMQDEDMSNIISLVDGLQLTQKQLKKGEITIPKYRALYLDSVSKEENITYLHKDKDFRQLVRNMRNVEDNEFEVPQSLQNIMREYQKSGFRWLKALHKNGFGGILADDMGLGKTLQVVAFLVSEFEEQQNRSQQDSEGKEVPQESLRTLIVCPASLVYNWKSEIERFAPLLKTVMVTGDAASRKDMVMHSTGEDILITSYDLLKRDIENYEAVDFFCEIIDEAQFIKNQNTQAAKAVKMVEAGTKFALTGTPMENRLSELWSIFDYLMPGFLFGYKQFKEEIESPIVEEQDTTAMVQLRRFITPFVLRRLKKDVLKDLPDKIEEIVYARMEGKQQKLYEANVQKLKMQLDKQTEEEFKESRIQLLADLTRLRQLCCNPQLVYEDYDGQAAKAEVCMELLHNAIEGGHKILLFSQFTSMLELLVEAAEKEGIGYYKLTGQTSKERRMEMVKAFNEDDTSVFFISLKAGGTGLNLTSADIVIHFDPWWNVAAQNQATDRTHRIGQKNVVTVYKLIAKDSIEERIVKLQEMKQQLADQVLGGENMDKPTFSKEELLDLLK